MLPHIRNHVKGNQPREGTASVECALVSPLLILLILGALDVGQFTNVAQTVDNASREGARHACRDSDTSIAEINTLVLSYLANSFPALSMQELQEATNIVVSRGLGETAAIEDLSSVESGDPVSVRITFRFESVRWIHGFPRLDGETLSTKTVMRRE